MVNLSKISWGLFVLIPLRIRSISTDFDGLVDAEFEDGLNPFENQVYFHMQNVSNELKFIDDIGLNPFENQVYFHKTFIKIKRKNAN